MSTLSTRELASIIWIAVGLAWVLSRGDLRHALVSVFRAAVQWKLLLSAALFGAYMAAIVLGASLIGLWDARLLWQLTIWSIVSGPVLMFRSVDRGAQRDFLRSTLTRVVGLAVLVEFYVNAVTFHLVVELLLQAALAVLVGMQVASRNPEHAAVHKLVTSSLTIIGFAVLAVTGFILYGRRFELDVVLLSESLILTLLLPILELPFMYALSLYAAYELAFMRMHVLNGRRGPTVGARAALLVGLNGRLTDVWAFAGYWPHQVARQESFRSALSKVAEFRATSRGGGESHEVFVGAEH